MKPSERTAFVDALKRAIQDKTFVLLLGEMLDEHSLLSKSCNALTADFSEKTGKVSEQFALLNDLAEQLALAKETWEVFSAIAREASQAVTQKNQEISGVKLSISRLVEQYGGLPMQPVAFVEPDPAKEAILSNLGVNSDAQPAPPEQSEESLSDEEKAEVIFEVAADWFAQQQAAQNKVIAKVNTPAVSAPPAVAPQKAILPVAASPMVPFSFEPDSRDTSVVPNWFEQQLQAENVLPPALQPVEPPAPTADMKQAPRSNLPSQVTPRGKSVPNSTVVNTNKATSPTTTTTDAAQKTQVQDNVNPLTEILAGARSLFQR